MCRTTGVALTQVALLRQVALLEASEVAGGENSIRIGVSIRGLAMRVIIMRHGDAVFQGAERVLSSRGEQEALLTGLKLVSAFNITKIFCSSKRRAQQTAQIVHGLMRGRSVPEVQVLNELNPYGDASLVRDYLDAVCEPNDTVLLISHIPQVVNLSWTFCQQEIELPTFFTAGALVLEPRKKASKAETSSTFTSYCPCLFLAPNRELRLSSTPETVAAASAAHAVTTSASSHLVNSTISPLNTVPFASAPFAAACSVESHSEDVTTPDDPLSADPLRECAALLIPSAQLYSATSTFDASALAPEHSQQSLHSDEHPALIPADHASGEADKGLPLHTAAATAAAAAAVAASALVVPAVKLSENGSLPLAVAVAAATIPAAMRKAQGTSTTANQTQSEHNTTISAGAVHNRHSQRMLSLLSAAHA